MSFLNSTKIQVSFSQQLSKQSGWLFYLLGITLLWWWNWKLLLATVGGMSLMFLVYSLQNNYLQQSWRKWQRFLTGSSGKLAIAVGSGGIGALSTYLAASIWADAENHWLATGLILQGLGTLITLALLVWQINSHRDRNKEAKLEWLLSDLTARDVLKRLIAIRQLTRLAIGHRLTQSDYNHLVEYFRLMFSQSQDAIVKDALLDSLESLGIRVVTSSRR
jgi:hypothetical protein